MITENIEGTAIHENFTIDVQSNRTVDINTSLDNTNDHQSFSTLDQSNHTFLSKPSSVIGISSKIISSLAVKTEMNKTMTNNNDNYLTENKTNHQPSIKFDQQNRQLFSKYGSYNRDSANDIVSLIYQDFWGKLVENDNNNNSIYNNNNNNNDKQ